MLNLTPKNNKVKLYPYPAKYILLQSERLSGCKEKACYKNKCANNPNDGSSPINEIDPKEVFNFCVRMLAENE